MELSILIPARNEMFLCRTVEDILANMRADTEIIVALDGCWADPPLEQHERVTVIHNPVSVGQRAATNQAARIARGKWIMKVDAHCAFAEGFDRVMLDDIQEDWTMVPVMKNLHAFDWVCSGCGERTYQGPKRCGKCGSGNVEMEVVWYPKPSPNSTAYRFDNTLHFRYWREYAKRPEAQGELTETMSLQGSCWMLSREKYFELNVCDEEFGSWGQQGVEVACKTWLSGGRVICNKRTWYAHMFRTQDGFKFPYPLSGRQVEHARAHSRKLFMGNQWEGAVRPFQWILDHFAPVPDWESSAGILYYTDNRLEGEIMEMCMQRLLESADGMRIVSVSLKPITLGDNLSMPMQPGYLTMFEQIVKGLKTLETDIVFFAEHDVLYNPTHFQFRPPERDTFYYNTNVWKVRWEDGHAVKVDDCRQTSGLCAYRELLLEHYSRRLANTLRMWKELGDSRAYRDFIRRQGFEPGTHGRAERVDDYGSDAWQSAEPIFDIRHGGNLTPSRWNRDQFRNDKYTRGWVENKIILRE